MGIYGVACSRVNSPTQTKLAEVGLRRRIIWNAYTFVDDREPDRWTA
jgi:hypothetical protein